MHPSRKLQRTTKDVSIRQRIIDISIIELMKSENFLRWVTDIFWLAEKGTNIGSSLCLFISIPDTYPEVNSTTIQSGRIALIFISVLSSVACSEEANSSSRGFHSRQHNWYEIGNGVHNIIYTQINKLKQEQRGGIFYSVCLVNKEALSEILQNLNFLQLAPRPNSGLDIFNVRLNKTRKGIN